MRPQPITSRYLRRLALPSLTDVKDKDARGRVLIIAGGGEVPGAALLCGVAALRAGAGKLHMAAAASFGVGLGLAVPEARVSIVPSSGGEISQAALGRLNAFATHQDAVVIGPGMLREGAAGALAAGLIEGGSEAALVVDAGALAGLAPFASAIAASRRQVVLTPHFGEMAALLGVDRSMVEKDPQAAAREASMRFEATVVLKGETTWVVSPDGSAWKHRKGVVGLGTSGSGDVLAGLLGGFLARGAEPACAAAWAVFVHAAAGRLLARQIGRVGFLAREIAAQVPHIIDGLMAG